MTMREYMELNKLNIKQFSQLSGLSIDLISNHLRMGSRIRLEANRDKLRTFGIEVELYTPKPKVKKRELKIVQPKQKTVKQKPRDIKQTKKSEKIIQKVKKVKVEEYSTIATQAMLFINQREAGRFNCYSPRALKEIKVYLAKNGIWHEVIRMDWLWVIKFNRKKEFSSVDLVEADKELREKVSI